MRKRLLFVMTFCLTMGMYVNAAITASRTARTVDVIWTIDPTAASYKVYGLNNVVKATVTAVPAATGLTTNSATITGLTPNTEYSFSVSSFDASGTETPMGMITIMTRRAGANYEIIEDFEDANATLWGLSNKGLVTAPDANAITAGINPSSSCLKFSWVTGGRNYAGPIASQEKLILGPATNFQYLHVKMYRVVTGTVQAAPELGGFSLQTNTRSDDPTITGPSLKKNYNAQFVDGVWHDYVFDLKNLSATDKALLSFYFKMNEFGGGSYTMATDYYACLDDIYLSNSAALLNTSITPVNVTLVAGANGTVPASGTYLKGSTITAVPAAGYAIDNWSDGVNVVSTTADCVIPGAGTLTASFKLASGINDLVEGGFVTINGRNIEVLKNISSFDVYSSLGTLVLSQQNVAQGATVALARGGVYVIKLKTEQGVKIQKVIVQ